MNVYLTTVFCFSFWAMLYSVISRESSLSILKNLAWMDDSCSLVSLTNFHMGINELRRGRERERERERVTCPIQMYICNSTLYSTALLEAQSGLPCLKKMTILTQSGPLVQQQLSCGAWRDFWHSHLQREPYRWKNKTNNKINKRCPNFSSQSFLIIKFNHLSDFNCIPEPQ